MSPNKKYKYSELRNLTKNVALPSNDMMKI